MRNIDRSKFASYQPSSSRFYLIFSLSLISIIFILIGCFDIDPLTSFNKITCPDPVALVYDRIEHFGDWIDEDGDGEDTRWEVLVEENVGDSDFIYSNNVKLFKNPSWECPYSGLTFSNSGELDIDHVVPTKEAWVSGACFWSQKQRVRFYNFLTDPTHLIAVDLSLNRQKGNSDPVSWVPPNALFVKNYLLYWANIKANWGLTADVNEYEFLVQNLGSELPPRLKVTTCSCE